MHIVRKTNQELVVLDSSIWISVGLLCVSVFVVYQLIEKGNQRGLLVVGLFLLFALLFWRREVVVFDAARQQAEWRRRRFLKVATGTVPFSEITGIGMETTTAKNNELCYRLTMLTPNGSVPMADTYASNREKYENLRNEILSFLHLDSGEETSMHATLPASGIADEASVRSLLQAGPED
jgi:hypothetical protein